ncbi:long-chain fatty acid--CoA ligase [Arthrobacter sp. D1-29]
MDLALLIDMASGHGDRVVLGSGESAITASRLRELAGGGAGVLTQAGAQNVVLLARNGPIVPVLLFSGALAGVPFSALNYRLSADQIREQLARLDAPFVVVDEEYRRIVEGSEHVVTVAEFFALAGSAEPIATSPASDSVAAKLFTSGTTSKPKIVPLRHENLFAYVSQTVEFGGATENETALVCVPPYHVAALGSVLTNLYAGRRVAYLPDFDANSWLSMVKEEGVTSAMLVPTMISRLVETLAGEPADAPTLRQITYGGSKMPTPVLERALLAFPGCGFVNAYGLTETSSTIALLGPDDHRTALASSEAHVRARLSSAGRSIPGIELQIRDSKDSVITDDATGELWVRGAQVSGEYQDSGSVLDAAGWFPTKDRAWMDSEGYLFVEGRTDDVIIRGGENIAPAEIEDVLLRHPGILEAAVVGTPDDEWGERIVAVVVAREGHFLTESDVREWARARIRGSRTPDDVVWRNELPHTATGKLLRRELVAEIASRSAAGA